jgi:hypothetical protein
LRFLLFPSLRGLGKVFTPDFFAPDMRRCYLSSEEIWREITAYAFKLAMFRKFENIKSEAFPARRSRGDTI